MKHGCMDTLAKFLLKDMWFLLLLGIIAATPLYKKVSEHIEKAEKNKVYAALRIVIFVGLLLVDTSYMVNSSYNPFIYFNF